MIRAVTLDLDDTLWPIAPVMRRAEARLHAWLAEHCADVAAGWPVEAMRALRERVFLEHPHLAHDFTELRKLSLRHAFAGSGRGEDWVDRAFEVFYAARNEVELYPDAAAALERLAARWPLASLSNGNADLARIGLRGHFAAVITARESGVAKPDARIFQHAAAALRVDPGSIAHVGDDPDLDVAGAHRAGLRAIWLNREGRAWPHAELRPDAEIAGLDELDGALDGLCRRVCEDVA